MIVLLMKWNYALAEIESGGNMSPMIVLLMEWKYAHPNQKWREHVSHDWAVHEMDIRTH